MTIQPNQPIMQAWILRNVMILDADLTTISIALADIDMNACNVSSWLDSLNFLADKYVSMLKTGCHLDTYRFCSRTP